ncbi:WcaF family extracellular polysaccharide biosynthesis acetyltransferase [Terriglobus sp.]|uniref:WcaF family extracellular polysaccharide biosynthesis acetyltransferase n=1 Tax=Terriglobus sp. TaxID=1889013 RepID=UPI003B00704B
MTPRPTARLKTYDNSWYRPGPFWKRTAWFFLGQPLVASGWLPWSGMRVFLLRAFGSTIGDGVVIKPGVRVKHPWFFTVGNDCWIGEDCWIDNLTEVRLGNDVCLSQGAYLCTGNHNWSDPAFGLIVRPIECMDGSWAAARSLLLPGTVLGRGAIAAAGSVVNGVVPDFQIYAGNPASYLRERVIAETTATPERTLA